MMTSETIYKVLYGYASRKIDNIDIDKVLEKWEPTPANKPVSNPDGELINLLALLREDIRAAANKTAGKANIAKSMQAIIKSAQSYPSSWNFYAAFYSDGKITACDGKRILRSYEPFNIEVKDFEKWDKKIDAFINDAKISDTEELKFPTISELKAYIKLKKSEQKRKTSVIKYDFGAGKPTVNAQYLLDGLTAFTEVKLFYNPNQPITSPLYMSGKEGEYMVFPIREGA